MEKKREEKRRKTSSYIGIKKQNETYKINFVNTTFIEEFVDRRVCV